MRKTIVIVQQYAWEQERLQMYMYVVSHYGEKTAQRYLIVQIK